MSFAETPSPDEDKWNLRERMLEHVKSTDRDTESQVSNGPNGGHQQFGLLFRPRPPAPVTRSRTSRILARLRALVRPVPKGVNDNRDLPRQIWQHDISETVKYVGKHVGDLAQTLSPHLMRQLRPRLGDIASIPLAIGFFIVPLIALTQVSVTPAPASLAATLIGTSLLTSLIWGPRFGTIATLSAYTWLSLTLFAPNSAADTVETLAHWMLVILGGAGLAAIGIGLGWLSIVTRDLFRLAFKASAREADITEFQDKLRRAHHSDAILSYIVSYCRDKLGKRAIFLALQEGIAQQDQQVAFDIGKQLKSTGFARVVVNRQSYLPRAIQSFSSSGFEAFTLETPSGPVALLGIDISDGRKLSSLDRRYLKLLLVSAAYALERIFLNEKIAALEEDSIEMKSRNAAIMSIVANLSQTTQNLDDQAFGLHQLLDREVNRPFDTAINFIRRNISALKNSIELLRDVVN